MGLVGFLISIQDVPIIYSFEEMKVELVILKEVDIEAWHKTLDTDWEYGWRSLLSGQRH